MKKSPLPPRQYSLDFPALREKCLIIVTIITYYIIMIITAIIIITVTMCIVLATDVCSWQPKMIKIIMIVVIITIK